MEQERLVYLLAGFLSTKRPFTDVHPSEMVDLAKEILTFLEAT